VAAASNWLSAETVRTLQSSQTNHNESRDQ
jgi:hypothetical protein